MNYRLFRQLALGSALFGLTACMSLEERQAAFRALPQSYFQDRIVVEDDPLNPSIRINTRNSFHDLSVSNDQFLRASIMRGSGTLLLQVYVTTRTLDGWFQPSRVTFLHTLSDRSVRRLAFDVNCQNLGCRHYEDMAFDISAAELDGMIEALEAKGETAFVFRVHGRSGLHHDGVFHINELKAFRDVIAPYRPPDET